MSDQFPMRPYMRPRRSGTRLEREVIFGLHRNRELLDSGELTYGDLAERLGVPVIYLNALENSRWGQWMLGQLALKEGTRRASSEGRKAQCGVSVDDLGDQAEGDAAETAQSDSPHGPEEDGDLQIAFPKEDK